jgi:CDP-diacylglycerol--serine O-phosphatidyltransferase
MMHRDAAQVKANARAQLRRGMFVLPSLFTVGNIAAGYFSITETIKSLVDVGNAHMHLDWAAIAILFAIPFDALDGRIARMTNTCSDFGKELDSLADAITFGVAPSLLALIWGFHFLPDSINPQLHENIFHAGAFICFLFLIGGVSRLARFNISHDAQPRNPGRPDRKYFVGMPIPAAAGLIAAWDRGHVRVPHGQHLAVLVRQGAEPLQEPSLPSSLSHPDCAVFHFQILSGGDLCMYAGLHVQRHLGACGLLVVAAAAQAAGCGFA